LGQSAARRPSGDLIIGKDGASAIGVLPGDH